MYEEEVMEDDDFKMDDDLEDMDQIGEEPDFNEYEQEDSDKDYN